MKTAGGRSSRALAGSTLIGLFFFTVLADRAKRHGLTIENLVFVVPALVVLARPSERVVRVAMPVACVGHVVAFFATGSTQIIWYVTALFAVAVVIAMASRAASSSSSETGGVERRAALFDDVGPAARSLAVIGMGAAGFAKLNVDFLNPEVSCGAIYTAWMLKSPLLFFVPDDPAVVSALERVGMYGAVAMELGAPLLLCFARTRAIGLALFSTLCIGLAINPRSHYFDFAGLYFALALFFVPPRGIARSRARLSLLLRRLARRTRSFARARSLERWLPACVAALASTIAFGSLVGLRRAVLLDVMRWTLVGAWSGLLLSIAIDVARRRVSFLTKTPAREATRRLPARLALVAPLAMFVNEASPYFGLIHRPTMTMRANLRMQPGSSNHLLLRAPFVLPASRLVVVTHASHDAIQRGQRMSYARFVELMSHDAAGTVSFTVDGGAPEVARGDDPRFEGGSIVARLWKLETFGAPRDAPNVCGRSHTRP